MFESRIRCAVLLCMVMALALAPSYAGAVVVKDIGLYKLGPGTYSYNLGQATATRANQSPISYKVLVTNGSEKKGKERVSSAVISLGGSELFNRSDFNQNVSELSADLTPAQFGNGRLDVRINGKVGRFLVISVSAIMPDPPKPPVNRVYFRDYDRDGWGDSRYRFILAEGQTLPTPQPPGAFVWSTREGDCNDRDPNVYPGNGCGARR